MTENQRRVFEDLTKDFTREEKEEALIFVEPGEGTQEKKAEIEKNKEKLARYLIVLEGVYDAITEDLLKLSREAVVFSAMRREYKPAREEDLKESRQEESPINENERAKRQQIRKQLEKAREFKEKHFKYGLDLGRANYLYELECREPWEGITRSFDLGYMIGYTTAQRRARKKAQAAANQEGEKRA